MKRYSVKEVYSKLEANKDIHLYNRPGSVHFHSNKQCPMLDNGQFEHYCYKEITLNEVKNAGMYPDACVVKMLGLVR